MSKKSLIERENKRRLLLNKFTFHRGIYKESLKLASNLDVKLEYSFELQFLPRNSAPCRLLWVLFLF